MPATTGAGSRVHAGEVEGGASSVPITAERGQQTFVVEGRVRKYWRRSWSGFRLLWHSLSLLSTVTLFAYQYFYPWGYKIPFGLSDDGSTWVSALVLCIAYSATRAPHLFGQEPGDWLGLLREVFYQAINYTVAIWFLALASGGMQYPPDAVGITWMIVGFIVALTAAQLVQAVILARRTWADSTGGV